MSDTSQSSFQVPLDELTAYLGEVASSFETHPDEATREAALGLLQGLDALHRAALARLVALIQEHNPAVLEKAVEDRLINTVLSLYDLLPAEQLIRQAEAALARVRPYIESHGGEVKVLNVVDGTVSVAMGGACQGCAGATYTLERGIRQALEQGLPGFEDVIVHQTAAAGSPASSSGFISLDQVYTPPVFLQAPDFRPVVTLEELPLGQMRQVHVEDVQVLLINSGGEIYAVGAMCPGSMLPLHNGRLDGETILCGWHNERFDIRSGLCLDGAGTRQQERLPVYPVAVEMGQIWVAVNVPARPPVLDD